MTKNDISSIILLNKKFTFRPYFKFNIHVSSTSQPCVDRLIEKDNDLPAEVCVLAEPLSFCAAAVMSSAKMSSAQSLMATGALLKSFNEFLTSVIRSAGW